MTWPYLGSLRTKSHDLGGDFVAKGMYILFITPPKLNAIAMVFVVRVSMERVFGVTVYIIYIQR